jgi:hypothetical protein
MRAAVMACSACDTRVEGRFSAANEFASLADDELHLLRVFIHCEGSIREMEAALGVSYPTVKARLAALKQTLAAGAPAPTAEPKSPPADDAVAAAIRELQAGRIAPADAARLIREARAK